MFVKRKYRESTHHFILQKFWKVNKFPTKELDLSPLPFSQTILLSLGDAQLAYWARSLLPSLFWTQSRQNCRRQICTGAGLKKAFALPPFLLSTAWLEMEQLKVGIVLRGRTRSLQASQSFSWVRSGLKPQRILIIHAVWLHVKYTCVGHLPSQQCQIISCLLKVHWRNSRFLLSWKP